MLLGALILGVIATYAVVVSGNAKERHWAERADELRLQVAQAQLALEQYRSGRALTEAQSRTVEQILRAGPKGPVIIKPNFLSAEPTRYANALSAIFNGAGYDGVGDAYLEGVIATNKPGLFVAVRDDKDRPPQLAPIATAFTAAGIPFSAHAEAYVPDTKTVVILVGERP
jgi:type II secretory pathway pseudopilin PulG